MIIPVAAAQMEIKTLQPDENLKKAETFAAEAKEKGCEFICYPEMFITGFFGRKNSDFLQTVPGEYTDALCGFAARYRIHIIAGSLLEIENGNIYNTSVVIGDRGEIIGKYRKIRLWCGEKRYTTPGAQPGVFDTRWGKIGVEICWDLAFPEVSKKIALMGGRIIFCPAFWTKEDKYSYLENHPDAERLKSKMPDSDTEEFLINTCTAARAAENSSAVIFANACGETEIGGRSLALAGNTQVALPFYGRVKHMSEEGLLTAEIDTDLLNLSEAAYHTLEDSR